MAMTIEAPRSQKPAKKNTNWEKWGWIYMRVSGVLLVVLVFVLGLAHDRASSNAVSA